MIPKFKKNVITDTKQSGLSLTFTSDLSSVTINTYLNVQLMTFIFQKDKIKNVSIQILK